MSDRLAAFRSLVELSRSRVDPDRLAEAGELLDRAGERRLPGQHTVVALAGPTGSGKSSLFNALVGADVSEVGVRRPTTGGPVSCSRDPGRVGVLLDRLGVPPDARFAWRAVESAVAASGLPSLVLLDLPDHDSYAARHRAVADRLVRLVDVLVWVVDPEKYADAAMHERYLRPLAGHAEAMLVVVNKVDQLAEDAVAQVTGDLRRLLDEDGLAVGDHGEAGAQVLVTSALTGEGVAELRSVLASLARGPGAIDRRIGADLDLAAARLRPTYVGNGPMGLTQEARERFLDRLDESVGAAAAGQAAERGYLRGGASACATPYGRLLARRGVVAGGRRRSRRSFQTVAGPALIAQRAVVAEAVRSVALAASRGLPGPWARGVRQAAMDGGRSLAQELDLAALWADVRVVRRPVWWRVVGVVQWMLLAVALVGGVGLVARAVGAWAGPWGLPGGLLGGGVAAGLVLALLCRVAIRRPARRYGRFVRRRLRGAARDCGIERVLRPVEDELGRCLAVREAYAVASGG